MTIETKFNIGDEVWFYLVEPTKAEITAIIIHENYMVYHIHTIGQGRNNFVTAFKEEQLFLTKQELLDSL